MLKKKFTLRNIYLFIFLGLSNFAFSTTYDCAAYNHLDDDTQPSAIAKTKVIVNKKAVFADFSHNKKVQISITEKNKNEVNFGVAIWRKAKVNWDYNHLAAAEVMYETLQNRIELGFEASADFVDSSYHVSCTKTAPQTTK